MPRALISGVVTICCLLLALTSSSGEPDSILFEGEKAVHFLATAEVIGSEKIEIGVTRPQRLTMTDGEMVKQAVWKTVEVFRPREKMSSGRYQLGFRDSYRSEIAAYRLSVLLGLEIVPPTVERELDNERGSLQLWMDDCITERERKEKGLHAPDTEAWNRQMATVRLFHQLIHDTDFNNINNVLVTPDFHILVIDSSRGFYLDRKLRNEDALERFSQSLLDRVEKLEKESLKEALGEWLSGAQITALLHRRDQILDLVQRRVAEQGAEAVLFP